MTRAQGGTPETPESVLLELIEVLQQDPTVLLWSSAIGVVGATAFLAATVYAISRAGRFQPSRVVLSVVLGLVGLVSVLGAILQPMSQALGAVAATAVGGLAAALGTAYTNSKGAEEAEEAGSDTVTVVDDEPDIPNPPGVDG
jgi:predicted membrane channel-forming protein YqfA (hemolysin III family)